MSVAGVPAEFIEFLPKDSEEYKRWKASQEAGVSGDMEQLALKPGGLPPEPEVKQLPGGKKKKQAKPEVGGCCLLMHSGASTVSAS